MSRSIEEEIKTTIEEAKKKIDYIIDKLTSASGPGCEKTVLRELFDELLSLYKYLAKNKDKISYYYKLYDRRIFLKYIFNKDEDADDEVSKIIRNIEEINRNVIESISKCSNFDESIDSGKTLLHYLIEIIAYAIVSNAPGLDYFIIPLGRILKKVVNVNVQDDDGNTPLHYLIMIGCDGEDRDEEVADKYREMRRVIELLISNGADVSMKNKSGVAPLDILLDIYSDNSRYERYKSCVLLLNFLLKNTNITLSEDKINAIKKHIIDRCDLAMLNAVANRGIGPLEAPIKSIDSCLSYLSNSSKLFKLYFEDELDQCSIDKREKLTISFNQGNIKRFLGELPKDINTIKLANLLELIRYNIRYLCQGDIDFIAFASSYFAALSLILLTNNPADDVIWAYKELKEKGMINSEEVGELLLAAVTVGYDDSVLFRYGLLTSTDVANYGYRLKYSELIHALRVLKRCLPRDELLRLVKYAYFYNDAEFLVKTGHAFEIEKQCSLDVVRSVLFRR